MAYYDYAPDCGCGKKRCNGGWIYWNGSEYPCNYREQKRREEEKRKNS